MNVVQRFRNHMAEKGYEYTIKEAEDMIDEMQYCLELMSSLTHKQLSLMNEDMTNKQKIDIRKSIHATEEEFEILLKFILDIRE